MPKPANKKGRKGSVVEDRRGDNVAVDGPQTGGAGFSITHGPYEGKTHFFRSAKKRAEVKDSIEAFDAILRRRRFLGAILPVEAYLEWRSFFSKQPERSLIQNVFCRAMIAQMQAAATEALMGELQSHMNALKLLFEKNDAGYISYKTAFEQTLNILKTGYAVILPESPRAIFIRFVDVFLGMLAAMKPMGAPLVLEGSKARSSGMLTRGGK